MGTETIIDWDMIWPPGGEDGECGWIPIAGDGGSVFVGVVDSP